MGTRNLIARITIERMNKTIYTGQMNPTNECDYTLEMQSYNLISEI